MIRFKCGTEITQYIVQSIRRNGSKTMYDSYDAVKEIKHLSQQLLNTKHKNKITEIHKRAFEIYEGLEQKEKNHFVMNTLLKFYFESNETHKIPEIYAELCNIESVSYTILLKCCKKMMRKDKEKVGAMNIVYDIDERIHGCHHQDAVRGKTLLIDIYSECKLLDKAQHVFFAIQKEKRDAFVIATMIKCYVHQNEYKKAIDLYREHNTMENDMANMLFIKSCIQMRDFGACETQVHRFEQKCDHINILIQFYGEIGDCAKAMHLFEAFACTNNIEGVTVGLMMKYLIHSDENRKAIALYIDQNCIHRNNDILDLLFVKACGNVFDYQTCEHVLLGKKRHCWKSISFRNNLIDFYGKMGDLVSARDVFDSIPNDRKDVVSIGTMMKCLINKNLYTDAIQIYEAFMRKNTALNTNTYDGINTLYLKACLNMKHYTKCQQWIDDHVMHSHSIEFMTILIEYYHKTNDLDHALIIFNAIPSESKNTSVINTMMTCLMNHECYTQIIDLYHAHANALHMDPISNVLFIKACVHNHTFETCQAQVDAACNTDICELSIEFITTLIDFWGKKGDVHTAFHIFNTANKGKDVDLICINAMMNAFNHNTAYDECIALYETCIQNANHTSNLLYMKACVHTGDYDKCTQLIDDCDDVHHTDWIHSVIDFYGKIGDIDAASRLYAQNRTDIVSVNVMMNAYNNCNQYEQTLALFDATDTKDKFTYIAALNACGHLILLDRGIQIIDSLSNANDVMIQSAIIRFYAKCSEYDSAQRIFDDVGNSNNDRRGIVSLYGAIMDCHAKRGNLNEVLRLFEELKTHTNVGIPYSVYSIVLNACCNVHDALLIWEDIKRVYNIRIHPHLINAIIDCLAKRNHLDDAEDIYNTYCDGNQRIYSKFKLQMLLSILSSCNIYNDVDRARNIARKMQQIIAHTNHHQFEMEAQSMNILLSNTINGTP
eukprot:407070_1